MQTISRPGGIITTRSCLWLEDYLFVHCDTQQYASGMFLSSQLLYCNLSIFFETKYRYTSSTLIVGSRFLTNVSSGTTYWQFFQQGSSLNISVPLQIIFIHQFLSKNSNNNNNKHPQRKQHQQQQQLNASFLSSSHTLMQQQQQLNALFLSCSHTLMQQ